MRNLFHQALGLILGFILGLLSTISALSVFFLWVYSTTENKKKPRPPGYVDYRSSRTKSSGDDETPPLRQTLNATETVYKTREEADEVLNRLQEMIDKCGFATLENLKDHLDIESILTDRVFGWTSLDDITIAILGNGYQIKFPGTRPIVRR